MSLPPNIPKRGLSLEEAAEYCGVSSNTLQRHGPAPAKIGGRCVYDRKMIDLWLDHLVGIAAPSAVQAEDELQRAINARKNQVRHQAA